MADKATTTEITISADNTTICDILQNQYGCLEAGEARAALEAAYERVWNEEEFQTRFDAEHVEAPYVHVVDKESGEHGTVMFIDSPRFYFLFTTTEAEAPNE